MQWKWKKRKVINVEESEKIKYGNCIFLEWQVFVRGTTYRYTLIILDFREYEKVYSFGAVKLIRLNWIYMILSLSYISVSLESYYQAIKTKRKKTT